MVQHSPLPTVNVGNKKSLVTIEGYKGFLLSERLGAPLLHAMKLRG